MNPESLAVDGDRQLLIWSRSKQQLCAHLTTRIAALMVVVAAWISGCSGREAPPTVVVYVSADDHIARQLIQRFEDQTGIDVKMVGDTEVKKTTGLVQRLRNERDHPQADVFWSSEIFQTIELADDGVLASYTSEETADWPRRRRDADRRWYAFAARARVIVYSPRRVAPDEVPRTWMDLADPRWKDRIAMADPRFGTTGGHLGAAAAYWDLFEEDGFFERVFLAGLARNGVKLLPSGNAGTVRAVISGEADLGLTDTDDVWAARAQGHQVELAYPRHHRNSNASGGGTLLIPNTIALIAGCPHPEAGGRFIDFMLSEDAERMLAESVSHNIPLRSDLADAYPDYTAPDPLEVDFAEAARRRDHAVAMAMKYLAEHGGGLPESARDEP